MKPRKTHEKLAPVQIAHPLYESVSANARPYSYNFNVLHADKFSPHLVTVSD